MDLTQEEIQPDSREGGGAKLLLWGLALVLVA